MPRLLPMSFLKIPVRVPSEELLDAGIPAAEAETSLRDIEWIHRHLGGRRLMRRSFLPFLLSLPSSSLEFLDLGCGSGHLARDLENALERKGRKARIMGIDRLVSHVRLARRGTVLSGDAFRLPFPDNSFDVVFSTLFIHHFSPGELEHLFKESARVARVAVATFDITRTYLTLALLSAVGPVFFKSRVSLLDGKASVRQAYTAPELDSILSPVLPGVKVEPAGLLTLRILWKKPAA